MIYKCSISIFGDSINFVTNNANAYDSLYKSKSFFNIDNFSIDEYSKQNKYELFFCESQIPELILTSKNKIIYKDKWNEISNTTSLKSIIFQLIELSRQERNRFMLHAAAFSSSLGGVVLLGRSGSGKTSLLLKMCLEHSFSFIANDRVVLTIDEDNLFIDEGTKKINLRKSSVDIYNKSLSAYFSEKLDMNDWDIKHPISANDLNLSINDKRIHLNGIIIINIVESWLGSPKFSNISGFDDWRPATEMHEYFSTLIRGCEQVLYLNDNKLHNKLFMPLLDNNIAMNNRVSIINKIIEKGKLFYLNSSMKDAVEIINNEFK